jgi:NhaP-type Na+/H+ or K+/H+ antiporter
VKQVRSFTEISREYRALYGVGTILITYAAGEWVGGSGFLAVFAGGAIVAWLDYDLCDCFLDYSEITAEMTMLLAFILFGALLSTRITTAVSLPVLALAVLLLVVARPLAISLVLSRASVSRRARIFIGWFGPRGLSSLLFALLVVRAGVPGSDQLLGVVGLIVTISVVVHGMSSVPLSGWYARAVARETLAEEREGTAGALFRHVPAEPARIVLEELAARLAGSDPPIVLDVRSRSSYDRDGARIPGSIRVVPDRVIEWATDQPRERSLVTYCT